MNRDRRLDPKRSSAIVECLGGSVAVGKIFGIRSQSVSRWKKVGIPENRLQFIQMKFPEAPAVIASMNYQPWVGRS